MSWRVISECVDRRSGRRYRPGEVFDPPPDDDQAERLAKAGCLEMAHVETVDLQPERSAEVTRPIEQPRRRGR